MLEHVAERFRVLSDTTRLSIISTLIDNGELNVGQIVDALGASQANISKHLKVLSDAGIVARRAEGTAAYYTATDPSLISLCSIVCDRLRQQVAADARTFSVDRDDRVDPGH